MKWKEKVYKFVAYPVCVVAVYLGFVLLITYFLPLLNTLGTGLYQLDDVKLYTFYLMPFTALDTAVLIGYFRLCGRLCPKFCLWLRDMPGRVREDMSVFRQNLKREKSV